MAVPKRRIAFMVTSLAVVVALGAAALSYRAERQLKEHARRVGIGFEWGSLERRVLFTRARNVQLRFAGAPSMTAHANAVTLRGAVLEMGHAEVDVLRLVVTGDPSAAWAALRSLDVQGFPVSWRQLHVEYSHPAVGKLSFTDVRFASGVTSPSMTAAQVDLGVVRLGATRLHVQDSDSLFELRLREATVSLELRYFQPSSRGALWTLRVPNQPLTPLARLFGWQLGPGFAPTRVGGLLSIQPATDAAEHRGGQLQLVFDHWPKPDWPEVEALLGDVAAFSAWIAPTRDSSGWELSQADMSLLVFSLRGRGRLTSGPSASLTLDLHGARSCAAMKQLLPPSSYSARVQQHLAAHPSSVQGAAGTALAFGTANLRLRLAVQPQSTKATWQLQPGCGLGQLASGASAGSSDPEPF